MLREIRYRLTCIIASLAATVVIGEAAAASAYEEARLRLAPRIEVGSSLLRMTPRERREHAVRLARDERLAAATDILESLYRSYPGDAGVLSDLVSVLSWQDANAREVELQETLVPEDTPVYAIEAVARAARNAGHFDLAAKWYEHALVREPERTESRAGLALSLSDADQHESASATYAGLPAGYRRSVDGMLIEAYLLRRKGDPLMALLAYDRVLDAEPGNREALRGKLSALSEQLLPAQALALARANPGLASREEIAALEADSAALWVRWGATTPWRGQARYADVDQALYELERNERRFRGHGAPAMITRYDKIVALRERARYADTVAAYSRLGLSDDELPVYVLRAVAGAHLALRQPEESLRLYEAAGEKDPSSFELSLERFFALVELERHGEAMELADEILETQAIWRTMPGSRVIKPNPNRLKAEIAHALSRAYADQLDTSESLLTTMLAEAPHNTDLRQELANVYRWRGWPRRADFEYSQVLSVEPDLMTARVGSANTLLDLAAYREFESRVAMLVKDNPDDAGVRRLARRHTLHHRNQIVIAASGGESTGEAFGSNQHQADAWIYTRPLRHNWRPYLHLHDAFAEFTEGDSDRRRAGLGLEYRRSNHYAVAEITTGLAGPARTGLMLGYTWRPTDHWQFEGMLETESRSMPLRGFRTGVEADRLRLATRYRFSELAEVGLSGEVMDFSDGNFRTALLLDARRRLYNGTAWKIDVLGSLFTSDNDLTGVAYFSPSRDHAAELGADIRWRVFRRYERSFTQRLALRGGRYDQSGFAAGEIGSIEYEHIWSVSDALEFHYGVRRARSLYDGAFEYGTFFSGGLRGRF